MNNRRECAVLVKNCDTNDNFLWLSEAAERRLCWILTGLMVLAISPVFAVALLM